MVKRNMNDTTKAMIKKKRAALYHTKEAKLKRKDAKAQRN